MKLIRSDIFENLKMALSTLRANKLRSFLTVVGVMIGVITVMLISSIISGVDTAVKTELESYGTNSIYISKYNPGIHIGQALARRTHAQEPHLRRRSGARHNCRRRVVRTFSGYQ